MAQRSISDLKFQLKFVNLGADIPGALLSKNFKHSITLDFIQKSAMPGDLLVMSLHRGHFNEQRDKHIPLNNSITINLKTENFIKAMSPYIKNLNNKGVKVIFIEDTPLMQVISTSPACALQIKIFGESICRVSKKQDLHTRFREDFAYKQLERMSPNIYLWDPQPSIYGKNDSTDVIDENGNYIMQDWNHITQSESYRLASDFRNFINSIMNT
jgi:hypothetical protein